MKDLRLFKYIDKVDKNHAFVIATGEEPARKCLKKETSLELELQGSRFLEDIPKALEHWNETKNPIYINRILPF